jgi:AcrR family transcriptional regulator
LEHVVTGPVNLSAQLGIRGEIAALKRERTIAAAVDLFYERGYENTTLEAVAEQLGVTKPFIYAHFGSKADLLAEICGRGISESLNAIDRALLIKGSATEKLEELAQNFVVTVLENQKPLAIFAREEKNLAPADYERISDMRREFDRKLVGLLENGVRAREFHLSDPPIAALAIGGLVSWAYVWFRPRGRMTMQEIAGEMTKLILAMVGAERRGHSGGVSGK